MEEREEKKKKKKKKRERERNYVIHLRLEKISGQENITLHSIPNNSTSSCHVTYPC